jgi:hypothetical protein
MASSASSSLGDASEWSPPGAQRVTSRAAASTIRRFRPRAGFRRWSRPCSSSNFPPPFRWRGLDCRRARVDPRAEGHAGSVLALCSGRPLRRRRRPSARAGATRHTPYSARRRLIARRRRRTIRSRSAERAKGTMAVRGRRRRRSRAFPSPHRQEAGRGGSTAPPRLERPAAVAANPITWSSRSARARSRSGSQRCSRRHPDRAAAPGVARRPERDVAIPLSPSP